jgi:hypothetical protein
MSDHARAAFRWWLLGVALTFGDAVAPLEAALNLRVGSEFRVNSYTAGAQQSPDVTINEIGDFVVTWLNQGGPAGIRGQRFNSAGQRQGIEFQVSQSTSYPLERPAIAGIGTGFVIAWESSLQDGSENGVFARLFDGVGNPSGGEFQVNTYTSGMQYLAAISTDGFGNFVVAWQSQGQDGESHGIFARRFTSSGGALGGEFQVNTSTHSHQRNPSVGMRNDLGFVVVWHSYTEESGFGVFGRRFDSNGTQLATEFQVNVTTHGNEFYPRVAVGPLDGFVVTWENFQDGDARAIFARRFNSSGSPLGGELQVNSYTVSSQDRASVAIAGNGHFVVAWRSFGQDGYGSGVFGQGFDYAANRTGPEFRINTYTPSDQINARAAIDPTGDLVVVWQSRFQDGDQYGIFAQRFTAAATLDVDADGEITALTDGLLVLRWMFGFTGVTLITGAVDQSDCERCAAPAIADYLASIQGALNIDGSVAVDALTDGLLVLRWMFGFTGATLTTGAIDNVTCTRCNAQQVEDHLESL